MNEFEKRIKVIEQELVNLKTATEYTAVRSVQFGRVVKVQTGLYQITFDLPEAESVLAFAYCGLIEETDFYGTTSSRTPIGNTMVVEISTDYRDFDIQQMVTGIAPLYVLASRPVVSIERIS